MGRLVFSIATSVQPDILILDEVLAAGDASFEAKSKKRVQELWNKSSTILVVSHTLDYIKTSCDRGIWIDKGRVKFVGSAQESVDCYLQAVQARQVANNLWCQESISLT